MDSADLLYFGTCANCPSCGGVLEFSGQAYHCSSYSTDWAKCSYSTADGRKGDKAKLPPKFKSEFCKKVRVSLVSELIQVEELKLRKSDISRRCMRYGIDVVENLEMVCSQ